MCSSSSSSEAMTMIVTMAGIHNGRGFYRESPCLSSFSREEDDDDEDDDDDDDKRWMAGATCSSVANRCVKWN
ncbi:unnamed protein product [Lampetra planeri]